MTNTTSTNTHNTKVCSVSTSQTFASVRTRWCKFARLFMIIGRANQGGFVSLLTEIISNAHMAGQNHAGCAHPSWGDALGHAHTILPETLDRAARQYIKEAEQTPTNTQKPSASQIAAEIQGLHDLYWTTSHDKTKALLDRWARQLRLL